MISYRESEKLNRLLKPLSFQLSRLVSANIARLQAASTGSPDDARRQDKSKGEEFVECIRLLPFLACADRYGRADVGLSWISQWALFCD